MSKRLRSASSRFNLTEWKVGIYLITAAQALLSAVSLPRCLDPQGSLVFDSREGRLKCSRSAPFWLAPDSLSFFLPIQYPLRSLSVTFSLFLFLSLSPPLPIHLSFPGLFICRKLDDTTSPWTWLALCQLSYRLLFHEHHHYYFSSLLLSLILFFFFLTHSLQHQWLKFMSNSMTTLTEVFNSFKIRKSAFFSLRGVYTPIICHSYLPFSRMEISKKGTSWQSSLSAWQAELPALYIHTNK